MKKEAGHSFLARLGKTRLRPGGKVATEWLLQQATITQDTKILEVACNMGTTMIHLAKTYQCKVIGIDQDERAVATAQKNIQSQQLEEWLTVQKGNALHLPFEDHSFDIVINEAMLTMLPAISKQRALKEYFRVLKPGGVLLTHDVCLVEDDCELVDRLSETIHLHVHPLTHHAWKNTLHQANFEPITQVGAISLMNPIGLIQDEGVSGAVKIIKNGLKRENRMMFTKMFFFFKKYRRQLQYIAIASMKQSEQ